MCSHQIVGLRHLLLVNVNLNLPSRTKVVKEHMTQNQFFDFLKEHNEKHISAKFLSNTIKIRGDRAFKSSVFLLQNLSPSSRAAKKSREQKTHDFFLCL